MTLDKIERVLSELGCQKIKRVTNKIQSSCPFAPYKHKGGRDNNPSFYAFLNANSVPGFQCHACDMSGSLVWLLISLKKCTGRDYFDLSKYIKDNSEIKSEVFIKKNKEVKPYFASIPFEFFNNSKGSELLLQTQEAETQAKELPEDHLKSYFEELPEEVIEYLTGPARNLNMHTINAWEIGWHAEREYISLPIRDINGRLVGISGRAFDQEKRPKYLHSENFDRNKVLYGENKISKGGRCHLVEGHFDAEWLWQNGYSNPLAVMGTYLSAYNVKKIIQWFDEVCIVSDGDVAGLKAQQDWKNLLKDHISVIIPDTISGKDPNKLTPSELEKLLGKPRNKKRLTSWFDSGNNIRSWASGSLTSEEEKNMCCERCKRDFQVTVAELENDFNLSIYKNETNVLALDAKKICDSCIRDIERLINQIKQV